MSYFSRAHESMTAARFRKMTAMEAWAKNGNRCAYCLNRITRSEITADHVKPKGKGGTDHENITCACQPCNAIKSGLAPDAFMKLLSCPLTEIPMANRFRAFGIAMIGIQRRINLRIAAAEREIGRLR